MTDFMLQWCPPATQKPVVAHLPVLPTNTARDGLLFRRQLHACLVGRTFTPRQMSKSCSSMRTARSKACFGSAEVLQHAVSNSGLCQHLAHLCQACQDKHLVCKGHTSSNVDQTGRVSLFTWPSENRYNLLQACLHNPCVML